MATTVMQGTIDAPAPEAVTRAAFALIDTAHPNRTLAVVRGEPITIGSGPRCAVRLEADGVQPLHCVITAVGAELSVKRWAPGALLNGDPFDDAELAEGDLLSLGDADLRVVRASDELIEIAAAEEPTPEQRLRGRIRTANQRARRLAKAIRTEKVDNRILHDRVVDCEMRIAEYERRLEQLAQLEEEAAYARESAADAAVQLENNETELAVAIAATNSAEQRTEELEIALAEALARIEAAEASAADPKAESATAPEIVADEMQPAEDHFDEHGPAETVLVSDLLRIRTEEADPVADAVESAAEPAAHETPDGWQVVEAHHDLEVEGERPTIDIRPVEMPSFPTADRASSDALAAEPDAETDQESVADPYERASTPTDGWQAADAVEELATATAVSVSDADFASVDATVAASSDAFEADVFQSDSGAVFWPELSDAQPTPATESPSESTADDADHEEEDVASEPADDSVSETIVLDRGRASFTAEPVEESVATAADPDVADPDAGESGWGIERLATETTPSEAAAFWGLSEPEAAGDSDPEPVVEPTAELVSDEPAGPPITADLAPAVVYPEEPVEPTDQVASGLWQETYEEPDAFQAAPLGEIEPVAETVPNAEASSDWVEPIQEPQEAPSFTQAFEVESDEAEPPASDEQPAAQLADWIQDSEEGEPEIAKPVAQESFIDRYRHLLPDDEADAAPSEPVVAAAPVETLPVADAPAADEDESIDEYMRKMMDRIRGGGPDAEAAPSEPPQGRSLGQEATVEITAAAEPTTAVVSHVVNTAVADAESPILQSLDELTKSPRAVSSEDLNQMRELANQSAREAINVANVRQVREKVTLSLVGSVVVFCCGALASITASTALGQQFVGGLIAMGGSGWFFVQSLRGAETNARLAKELEAAQSAE